MILAWASPFKGFDVGLSDNFDCSSWNVWIMRVLGLRLSIQID